ncbi:TetR family transcriptional regulator [Qaidamihabitans albus]|uniref:TetR family transcriptional regulator n=1 Tax=Qaidamihabitans albus TaxID=2795733 RepID=UPI0018F15AD7|nr:TetR family transcriptional regulator [Qaidamihabitans albus]
MPDELASKIVAAKSTKRATKQLIYEHALRLFATQSYAKTGLRDIAQAVGVEVASLYTHIDGKNALLFDLMDYGTRDLLQRLTSAIEDVGPDPLARLYALVREHVAVTCRRQNQTLVAFNEIRELKAQQRNKIIPLREEIESLYIGAVDEAIAGGRMRPVNVRITVYGILAMGRGVATWYRPDGPLTPEQVGSEYADQVLRGLMTTASLARFGDQPIELSDLLEATHDEPDLS